MPNNVYYSVSPFGTGDIKVACNITIAGGAGVATFSVAQTGNIGVGCHVISSGVDGYISVMTNSTTATIVTALGAVHGDVSIEALTSIAHEYASLSTAEAGASDASHIDNTSLVSADVVLNIPCYYDHDDDTVDSAATISGYTTDATRSIEIYTPQGGTESINDQRHNGIYSSETNGIQAYRMESTSDVLTISDGAVTVDGIQILALSSGGVPDGIRVPAVGGAKITIKNTIIKRESTNKSVNGIELFGGPSATSIDIINCIIYGFSGFNGARGILISDSDWTVNILNSTIYNNYRGISQSAGTVVVTNCAVGASNSSADDFVGTITIDHCASDAGDGTTAQTLSGTRSDDFDDVVNGEFAIASSSSVLSENGTDLSGSGVTDDIIRTPRPQSANYDISAFELIVAGGALTKTINEAMNINETLLNPLALKRILNEVEEISETTSRPRVMARILSETINISETILRPKAMLRVLNEAVNITESIANVLGLTKIINEAINITESLAGILGITKVINEAISIVEVVLARLSLTRVLNETVNITETILRPRVMARILNETINIVESIIRPRTLVRIFNEVIEIGEAILRPRVMVRVLNETVQIAESLARITGLVKIINETINISEAFITNVTAAAAIIIDSARRVFNMDTARRPFRLDTTRRPFNRDTIRRIFRVR